MAKAVAVADTESGLERIKSPFARLGVFLGDVRNETKKLSTPSGAEVRTTTAVVILTVFLFAAYFAVVDYAVNQTLGALLDKLTSH
jgi:preprotein translocase subunit SecE